MRRAFLCRRLPRELEADDFPRAAFPPVVDRFAVDRPPSEDALLLDDLRFDDEDAVRPPDEAFVLLAVADARLPFAAGFEAGPFRDGDVVLFLADAPPPVDLDRDVDVDDRLGACG